MAKTLISHFINIPYDSVEELPISEYYQLLEVCIKFLSFYNGQGMDFQLDEDKHKEFLEEIELFKSQGRLN